MSDMNLTPDPESNKRTQEQAGLAVDEVPQPKRQQVEDAGDVQAVASTDTTAMDVDNKEESIPTIPDFLVMKPMASEDVEEAMNAQPEPSSSTKTKRPEQNKKKGSREYKGKHDRGDRVWEKRTPADGEAEGDKEARLPKKKVALLLGFSGAGYNGMQYQLTENENSAKTIEMIVFKALGEMGAISKDNSADPKKVDLSRAARTDAGVSAAGNVMSLKMITEPPGCETEELFVEKLNSLLPSDIRVWGFQRATNGFNARTSCDTRVYEYLFPSYILLPPTPGSLLDKHLESARTAAGVEQEPLHPFWKEAAEVTKDMVAPVPAQGEEPEDVEVLRRRKITVMKRGWRCGSEELERFREVVQKYLGTHNFHNYTLFQAHNSKAVKRHMLSIDVEEPQVYGNIEWISVKIHGQSFMLHQIRKMISMAVLATRTKTPSSVVHKTFGPDGMHIPKAPALGLLLEQPRFGSYNDRVDSLRTQKSQAQHLPVTFDAYAQKIHDFKVKHIYERLRQDEERLAVYVSWANNVDHAFDATLSWLGPTGDIPESAIKKNKVKEKVSKREKAAMIPGAESEDDENAVKNDDNE